MSDTAASTAATAQRGAEAAASSGATRWVQLVFGVICMMAISSPQYVWTLFTKPMSAKLGVSLAELQVTFSILIVLQTFLSRCKGSWLIDSALDACWPLGRHLPVRAGYWRPAQKVCPRCI